MFVQHAAAAVHFCRTSALKQGGLSDKNVKEWFASRWERKRVHHIGADVEQIKTRQEWKNKQKEKSKQTNVSLAAGEVLWWSQATSRGEGEEEQGEGPHLKCTCYLDEEEQGVGFCYLSLH